MVKIKLLRPWPVGGRLYRPGQIIEVPAAQADRMAKTAPPYAERVPVERAASAPTAAPVKKAARKSRAKPKAPAAPAEPAATSDGDAG